MPLGARDDECKVVRLPTRSRRRRAGVAMPLGRETTTASVVRLPTRSRRRRAGVAMPLGARDDDCKRRAPSHALAEETSGGSSAPRGAGPDPSVCAVRPPRAGTFSTRDGIPLDRRHRRRGRTTGHSWFVCRARVRHAVGVGDVAGGRRGARAGERAHLLGGRLRYRLRRARWRRTCCCSRSADATWCARA